MSEQTIAGDEVLEVEVLPAFSYSLQQNDVPLVPRLRIRNPTAEHWHDLLLTLHLDPPVVMPWETRLTELAPGQARTIAALDLLASHDYLANLAEGLIGAWHVRLTTGEELLAERAGRVDVLARDHWAGSRLHPAMLAAFVTPNQAAVATILQQAANLLGEQTGDRSLTGYQTRDINRVNRTIAAICAAVQQQGWSYIIPAASFAQEGQKIRLPERLMEERLGTCLDLACCLAACLEQAGLHSLLVLTAGHAFAGAWLVDESFADPLIEDASRLRKRADLQQLVLLETTLLTERPAPSYAQLRQCGRDHLDDADRFRFAVDVARARQSGIRPLPGRGDSPGGHDHGTPAVDFAVPSELRVFGEAAPETAETRLDRWKRRLLDLSLRNRLLNFRDGARMVPLLCPDLAAAEDAWAGGDFYRIEPRPDDLELPESRAAELFRRRVGASPADALLSAALQARRLHADLAASELDRRLTTIFRLARVGIEESGANTLYLAVGFLKWAEATGSSTPRYAPLLLLPVQLERRSITSGFRLRATDDDPLVNTTLLELLKHDFRLQVPGVEPLPRDERGVDVAEVFQRFREAVVDLPGWEVLEQASLSLFSFTKYLLWRDLEARSDDLQRNPLVRHLINTPTERFAAGAGAVAEDDLDRAWPASEVYPVVSLDSSQLAAVVEAGQGRTFVLQGPPGTGKSQTITALIAQALGAGKSVLFVAEKAAALDVVQRRLNSLGLGPFCLPLHSHKTQRLEVVKQLGATLEFAADAPVEDWLAAAAEVDRLRSELNNYSAALHRPQVTGESVYVVLGRLLSLRDEPTVKLHWQATGLPCRQVLQQTRQAAEKLQQTALDLGDPRGSVWRFLQEGTWSLAWQHQVEELLQEHAEELAALLAHGAELARRLGLPEPPTSVPGLLDLAWAANLLVRGEFLAELLASPLWDSEQALLTDLVQAGCEYQEQHNALARRYTGTALDELPKRLSPRPAAERLALATAALAEPDQLVPRLSAWSDALAALEAASPPVADWLALPLHQSVADLLATADLAAALQAAAPRTRAAWLQRQEWDDLAVALEDLLCLGEARDAARSQLLATHTAAALELDVASLRRDLETAEASSWLVRRRRRKAALAPLRATQQPAIGAGPEPRQTLALVGTVQEQQRHLQARAALGQELFGASWRDGEADWTAGWRDLGTCRQLRQCAAAATGGQPGGARALRDRLATALEDREDLHPEATRGRQLQALVDAAAAYRQAVAAATQLGVGHHDDGAQPGSASPQSLGGLLGERQQLAEQAVRLLRLADEPPSAPELADDLARLAVAAEQAARLQDAPPELCARLGAVWRGRQTAWQTLQQSVLDTRDLRLAATSLDAARATDLCRRWASWPGGETDLAALASRLRATLDALSARHTALGDLLGADWAGDLPASHEAGHWHAVQQRLAELQAERLHLKTWCDWLSARRAAAEHGLRAVLTAFDDGRLAASQLAATFEHSYARWFLERVIDQLEPALREFRRPQFERTIDAFQVADDRYQALSRTAVLTRLAANVPQLDGRPHEEAELGILVRQTQRQRGHLAVRELFSRLPTVMPRLKPCLLMSPLSVAQFLDPAHPAFDLVVFDEASQIPVWDAVGALARGRSAVIVGDPKQLPPTTFFERSEADDDFDAELGPDPESILEECLAASLPQRSLRWHYRSRHETLIAFSNHRYYENALITLPAPQATSAVRLRRVPGVYDRGGATTNRAEAEAVVAEIVQRLTDPATATQSIGVVTLNQKQQQLVEDLLDQARRAHPDIEQAFGPDAAEPVFVKNLENVQGDERDVILLSITYGRDAVGKLHHNFGPLNRAGGERRLNVAISRARCQTVVFVSFDYDDLRIAQLPPHGGLRDLRDFLEYAGRGPEVLASQAELNAFASYESPLEQQVATALQARGYEVVPQVGCAQYRIDLGVLHPAHPGRFLLGIECDGRTYHSAATARDRDRLRAEILRGLGWRLHRIWSTDWWQDPLAETDRAVAAIEAALTEPSAPATPVASSVAADRGAGPSAAMDVEPPGDPPASATAGPSPVGPSRSKAGPQVYRQVTPGVPVGGQDDFWQAKTMHHLSAAFAAVVEQDWPIHFDLAARRVASFWCIEKVSQRMRQRLLDALAGAAVQQTRGLPDQLFLWPVTIDTESWRDYRPNGQADTQRRDLKQVAPQELANAAAAVLQTQGGMPRQALQAETARRLGFQRVTSQMEPYLAAAVDLLLSRGEVGEAGDQIAPR
ncbi:MAG: DUF4011 domain-containing protein [Fimbriimonadaceae bacterium]|nr:DUF4011 domain-containing protein [Fimbriimonadaceae bacterium]